MIPKKKPIENKDSASLIKGAEHETLNFDKIKLPDKKKTFFGWIPTRPCSGHVLTDPGFCYHIQSRISAVL